MTGNYSKTAGPREPSSVYTDCYGVTHVLDVSDSVYDSISREGIYHGVRTPRYHSKKKSGAVLPLNTYFRADVHRERIRCGLSAKYIGCGPGGNEPPWVESETFGLPPAVLHAVKLSPASYGEHVNLDALVVAAMANLSPDLDVLTTLAEGHKTFGMIRKARENAADLITSARRGGFRTPKAAAKAWLEWQFGWKQLHRDVVAIDEFLRNPVRGLLLTASSGQSVSLSSSVETAAIGYGNITCMAYTDLTESTSIRARVVGTFQARTLNALMSVPVTAWELIPYSWVVDYFVNVGECIGAWRVKQSASSLTASLGLKSDWTALTRVVPAGNWSPYWVTTGFTEGTGTERAQYKSRVPWYVPSLVPSTTVRLSGARIANLAALLAVKIL